MAKDNKKTKVETAPKNEATSAKESAPKTESTPAAEPAKAEGAKAEGAKARAATQAPPHPLDTAGARVRSRSLKLTRTTGTRFSERRRNGDL